MRSIVVCIDISFYNVIPPIIIWWLRRGGGKVTLNKHPKFLDIPCSCPRSEYLGSVHAVGNRNSYSVQAFKVPDIGGLLKLCSNAVPLYSANREDL
jgi:hypothetical protein